MATYQTRPDDRWDLIASQVYGNASLWVAIAQANPQVSYLANSLILPAGQTVQIPDIATLRTIPPTYPVWKQIE